MGMMLRQGKNDITEELKKKKKALRRFISMSKAQCKSKHLH